MLKVCVNGARLPSEHPRLSADPTAIAEEARASIGAGARAVHVHPKSPTGDDSLAGEDLDRFVAAMRTACPRVPIGVTSGAWAAPAVAQRLAALRTWTVLPDFVSVNWHEDGADQVAEHLIDRGIGVEAGIWHGDGLDRWLASSSRSRCLRVLIELPDLEESGAISDLTAELVGGLRAAEPGLPILLHGEDRSTWPALELAARWGLDTRIGLEDTLVLPDGRRAQGNAELVATAIARIREVRGHGSSAS